MCLLVYGGFRVDIPVYWAVHSWAVCALEHILHQFGAMLIVEMIQMKLWGHGGRVVTLSPPTSAAGDRSPSWP